jgi:hypothetical protein
MLVLLALPSFGITTTASRLLGSERPAAAEELAERAPSCSQRRVQVFRTLDRVSYIDRLAGAKFKLSLATTQPNPVFGHRLSNGILAPLRC